MNDLKKRAIELIRGTLKRSKSYYSELEYETYENLIKLKEIGDFKAEKMVKLIKESKRLFEKYKNK